MRPPKSERRLPRIAGRTLARIRDEYRRLQPLCEDCLERKPPRVRVWTQLDHRIALVNGGKDFLEDPSQRQGLCDECHDIKTRQDLGQGPARGADQQGFPLDPRHHWNTP